MDAVELLTSIQNLKLVAENLDLPVEIFSRGALYIHRYMVRFKFPGM